MIIILPNNTGLKIFYLKTINYNSYNKILNNKILNNKILNNKILIIKRYYSKNIKFKI